MLEFFFVFFCVYFAYSASYVTTPSICPNKYGNCYILPPEDEWNRVIENDPVDFMSDCYITEQLAGNNLRLDMGTTQEFWGIPYIFTTNNDHLSTIEYGCGVPSYEDESDQDAPIEGGSSSEPDPDSGDRHVLAINSDTCMLYETYNTVRRPGSGFCCSSSAKWDLSEVNNVRPAGWTSADAAGLPIFPGLIRYDEASRGEIKHALRYGTRFRLKSSVDLNRYSGEALAILQALKKYGMYFADQGSAIYIQGMSHPNFGDAISQINQLEPRIDGSDFEAVQSPYSVHYDPNWDPSVVCDENGKTENDNPSWQPNDVDYSVCYDDTSDDTSDDDTSDDTTVDDDGGAIDSATFGAVIGGVVGGMVFIIILLLAIIAIIVIVVCLDKKRKNRYRVEEESSEEELEEKEV